GLYLSAFGGHNAQSHNHNDVGNAVVYADGQPVLVDVGVEEYTSKTFSPRRYEIWTMQSGWHNLPAISGLDQGAGRDFRARDVTFAPGRDRVRFSVDIAPAWPAEAKVAAWRREVALDRRKREVVLAERFALGEAREPVRLHFLTPLVPDVSTAGRVVLARAAARTAAGARAVLLYDPGRFTAAVEEKLLDDARLRRVWGERLHRIVLTARGRALRGAHRVILRAAR
ncbi:MAG TPA: heparinase II/III family protein, partial [Frankiaceae bacterium]|nr:heparinase II/III family protein [Frankiaceae bacterium]